MLPTLYIGDRLRDIILLDDSFSSIVNAVVWGRSLYQNIQRFIVTSAMAQMSERENQARAICLLA